MPCLKAIQPDLDDFGKCYEGLGSAEQATLARLFDTTVVEALIDVDRYYKEEHPEKLPMYLRHGWAARPPNLGIPHQGGLIDAIRVAEEFGCHVIQSRASVPLPLFRRLLEHLERYYGNLQRQPHQALFCLAAEVKDLRRFVCSCASCVRLARFFALEHDRPRLELEPGEDAETFRHLFEKKLGRDQALDLREAAAPKTLATAQKRGRLVFEKFPGGQAPVLMMLDLLRSWREEVDHRAAA